MRQTNARSIISTCHHTGSVHVHRAICSVCLVIRIFRWEWKMIDEKNIELKLNQKFMEDLAVFFFLSNISIISCCCYLFCLLAFFFRYYYSILLHFCFHVPARTNSNVSVVCRLYTHEWCVVFGSYIANVFSHVYNSIWWFKYGVRKVIEKDTIRTFSTWCNRCCVGIERTERKKKLTSKHYILFLLLVCSAVRCVCCGLLCFLVRVQLVWVKL